MTRVRFRFEKLGKIRFTSHRDVARMWERAFRRIGLPLAYTAGFNPRPKVSFGLALPTGAESVAEYLDVDLAEGAEIDVLSLPADLSPALPVGVDVTAAGPVAAGTGSLQKEVTSCVWELTLPGLTADDLAARVEETLAAATLIVSRERKGQVVSDDLRPALLSLAALPPADLGPDDPSADRAPRLQAEVASAAGNPAGGRTTRPNELVEALWPGLAVGRVRRTIQWIERDGTRREPLSLPLAATSAPHALGCAT